MAGTDPLWDTDSTIYYLNDGDLYEAHVRTSPSVSMTSRQLVLEGPFISGARARNLDREPNGGRFALVRPADTDAATEITVIMNWFRELEVQLAR